MALRQSGKWVVWKAAAMRWNSGAREPYPRKSCKTNFGSTHPSWGGRFRGIRHITAWDDDDRLINKSYSVKKGLLADPNFRAGFAELEKLNLSFDAWLYHPQIDDLTDLAQNFPGTAIILDHCGGPLGLGEYARASTNVFASWRKSIEKLAACRNVRVKLGGLGMRINDDFHEKHLPPTSDELVKAWFPYFDTCIQAFGPDRCMFESNFPVDKGSYSYPIYWNACKKFTNDFNIEDREYLFQRLLPRFIV